MLWHYYVGIFNIKFICRVSERQIQVFKADSLNSPLNTVGLDVSPAILIPFYDEDSSTLFLTGKVRMMAIVKQHLQSNIHLVKFYSYVIGNSFNNSMMSICPWLSIIISVILPLVYFIGFQTVQNFGYIKDHCNYNTIILSCVKEITE